MREKGSVRRYVAMIHRYARIHFAGAMAPYGIPDSTFPFLMRLYHEDDVSQDKLAQFHHTDKATAARALAKLEDAGFVTRTPDADDRRIKRVRLTAKAKQIRPQLQAILEDWSKALTDGFTKQEQEMALCLLQRMTENARRVVDGSE
jgi:DNA-binding MarR family transcriptional regulator